MTRLVAKHSFLDKDKVVSFWEAMTENNVAIFIINVCIAYILDRFSVFLCFSASNISVSIAYILDRFSVFLCFLASNNKYESSKSKDIVA